MVDRVRDVPMDQPSTFLQGWHKLPDELKVMILRYAVPYGETFSSVNVNKSALDQECRRVARHGPSRFRWQQEKIDQLRKYETHVMPLLTCPETAGLAAEIFYAQNNMVLRSMGDRAFWRPPSNMLPFIRSVETSVVVSNSMFEFFARDLSALSQLTLGLPNLRNLILVVVAHDYYGERTKFVDSVNAMAPIALNTRRLDIRFQHGHRHDIASYGRVHKRDSVVPRSPDPLAIPLLAKFTVVSAETVVQNHLGYYYEGPVLRQRIFVDDWPQEIVLGRASMVTRRVVWI